MSVLSPTPTPTLAPTPARAPVRRCDADRKLYLPYSSLRLFGGEIRTGPSSLSPVTIHWFMVGRQEPVVPYATTIQGYQALTPVARERAEAIVDEFFREDEFHQFCEYLQSCRRDVRTSMLTTPISSIKPDATTQVGAMRPFGKLDFAQHETVAIYRISEEEGYSLPFTVWGAYMEMTPSRHRRME